MNAADLLQELTDHDIRWEVQRNRVVLPDHPSIVVVYYESGPFQGCAEARYGEGERLMCGALRTEAEHVVSDVQRLIG